MSMKSLRARNITSVCMLIAVCAAVAWTQARKPPSVQRQVEGTRPRLVLLIVVDQFRYDYLTRFGDLFGSRGLGRLMRRGADWTHANFDHVPTFTAPGHAVFMTGARSEEHTSELQSRLHLVCRLLLEKKKKSNNLLSGVDSCIHLNAMRKPTITS